MTDTRYAVCCRGCGHIEDKAWSPSTADEHSKRTEKPLTPQGHVPIYCQRCGARSWDRPATKEQLEAYESAQRREARAIELCARDDFDGIFKIPDEFRGAPEVKRALSNLLGPLEGEVLKNAQANIVKLSRAGMNGDSLLWIEWCDKAVQRALPAKGKAVA